MYSGVKPVEGTCGVIDPGLNSNARPLERVNPVPNRNDDNRNRSKKSGKKNSGYSRNGNGGRNKSGMPPLSSPARKQDGRQSPARKQDGRRSKNNNRDSERVSRNCREPKVQSQSATEILAETQRREESERGHRLNCWMKTEWSGR